MKKNRLITYGSIIVPPILIYIVMTAAIIIPLMYDSIFGAITMLLIISLVTSIIPFLIASIHLKLVRNNLLSFKDYLIGEIRHNGIRYFIGSLLMQIYIFLWSLLFTIPGIIKQYSYAMTPYILKDNEDIGTNDAITESRKMMDGHKKSLFFLHLNYILQPLLLYFGTLIIISISLSITPESILDSAMGMIILIIIGFLFVAAMVGSVILTFRILPRITVASALFYEEIRGDSLYAVDETLPEWDEKF